MTDSSLAERLAALSPQQRAELVRNLRPAQPVAQPIVRLPRSEPTVFDVSFEQRRVWFLDRFDPGGAAHNLPFALDLDGDLDLDALQRSLDGLVVRHEALRTTFLDVDGSPRQLVGRPYPVALAVVDLTGEPADQRDAIAHEVIQQEAGRGFDLDTGPLWRAMLVRLAPRHAILQLTIHHSVCDGWSTGVLLRDLVAGYRGEARPAPPIQYADYAAWQSEQVSGPRLDALVGHWREQLAGTPPLNLPTDRPRPAVRRSRGALDTSPLGPELSEQLREFAQRHQVTPFVTLLAALEVLLMRYCGQDDFAVGTVLAGRDLPELGDVVGFVARTVALRSDVTGPEAFSALLRRVHERVLVAHEHSQLPFEKLVDELRLPRDPSRPPLFSVLLVLQNTPRTAVDLPGLRLRAVEPDSRAAQFDLSWYVSDTPAGFEVSVEYDTDLFGAATVRRLTGHLRTLLAAAMSAPDTSIRRLPLLTDTERRRQLHDWNDTTAAYPDAPLGELIARQAAATPDAVAVRSADADGLTYAELDGRANQVARWLLARGAAPGTLVGVGPGRTPQLVAALLGVLRTGAAYVPLDPDYPAARVAQMVEDGRVRLLIADRSTVGRLPADRMEHVLLLDTDPGLDELPGTAVPVAVDARQAAYTIFTSGSTGRPKGVTVSHRALVNLLESVRRRCGLDADTVLAAVTSLSFDIAGLELYAPLLAGGQVVLCDRETVSGADTLRAALERVAPTVMQATPATWQLLLDGGWPGAPGLVALCGGEALPAELAAALTGRVGQLWNMYGPTETTIWSGALRLDGPDVAVGGPLANQRIYLLDAYDQPVPPGVAGQVHLAGDGLADGYLHAPALTASRFVPDPFVPGERMYRTGDAARWRPDGRLDFLGRLDHQVKVRGHRIELGDIETALDTAPGVARSVVTTYAAPGGQAQLAAYIQPAPGASPTVAALREHLAGLLPGYMVPARFAVLAAFPLTPNGKIDRKALPAPDTAALDSGTAYRPPVGETETVLAGIWAELLHREQVGRDDNFFTIGGDSLVAVRMVARAGQLGVQLTTKQVFLHQQLHQLAAAAGTVRLVAEQGEVTGTVPLPIATHQFYDGVNPRPDFHALAFQFAGRERLDPDLLEQVLDELVRQHDALRIRLLPGENGGRPRLHVDPYRPRRLVEQVDLSDLDEAGQAQALEAWTDTVETGFRAEHGDLFRAVLLDVGPDHPQHLLLGAHYLVADVVSWHILAADLDVMYRRRIRQEPYRLPAKTTSLLEWIDRLVEQSGDPEVLAETPLWTDPVRREAVAIPVDRPDGDNRVAANDAAFLILTVEETRDLQERVVRAARLPMDAVLLAGIGHALTAATGAQALPVDIYVPGRDSPFADMDLSRTVGWLTYRYPMWLDVRRGPSMPDQVQAIACQLAAVPRGGLGYGSLRYYRGDPAVAAELADQPVPDVLFNFFGAAPGGFQVLKPLAGTSGHYHDTESERMRLLMINGAVFRGQLRLEWEYSSGRHDAATVEAFIAACRRYLLDLIDACPPAGG
ncbi:amino acid adenylation domain-containing protein [Catellatospora methionotrophica]|uniref:amino acid adenylation domain-containing protein n=1 Tax=Catellatospora methionotrophica TaxID=121620 RepID=UPI0033D79E91